MTHETAHAGHGHKAETGSAALPAIFSILLTLIWGAYTVTVVYEIARLPMPAF